MTLVEATFIFNEWELLSKAKEDATTKIVLYYLGFVLFNFFGYTIIPWFIKRYGATLFNISNLTTILWSMLSDILLFDRPFVSVLKI